MEIIQPGSIGDILYLGPSRKIFPVSKKTQAELQVFQIL